MPQDADTASTSGQREPRPQKSVWQGRFISTPQPIKRLFDKFPLVTYQSNELPRRKARRRDRHALYVFTTEDGARNGAPSFNPGCLKWQAYLRFNSIDFLMIPSNNHASPTGALPFLLPAASDLARVQSPISSNSIQRWVRETVGADNGAGAQVKDTNTDQSPRGGSSSMRYEAYKSLLDYRIRNAYLYSIYLIPSNFDTVVRPRYVDPTTSNPLVHLALSRQLRVAAESELLKHSAVIDAETIYRESANAFEALQVLLGDDDYFFGAKKPGLFDASVFAYTHVLLGEFLPQLKDTRMMDGLKESANIKQHRDRILQEYFRAEF